MCLALTLAMLDLRKPKKWTYTFSIWISTNNIYFAYGFELTRRDSYVLSWIQSEREREGKKIPHCIIYTLNIAIDLQYFTVLVSVLIYLCQSLGIYFQNDFFKDKNYNLHCLRVHGSNDMGLR